MINWLTWLNGAILAAAVIPPLLLLYFLRLRRREHVMPSTLLWRTSVQDLRANAPFQRLRPSILLFLQLLVLALIALAVMQPQLQGGAPLGGKTVMLIDMSASMNATDAEDGRTRLEIATERARELIQERYGGGLFTDPSGETMIVGFHDRAEMLVRFTNSRRELLAGLERIRPTDGESRIEDALKLARAYTTNVNPDSARPVAEAATLELFSDGRIQDLEDQVIRRAQGEAMTFYPIGTGGADNVGFATISAERPYDNPTEIQVFAALVNFNPTPVECDVQLSVNGDIRAVTPEPVPIPAAETDETSGLILAGRATVVFTPFAQPAGAVIEVTNLRRDDLASDNAARLVVPPPKELQVALVTSRPNPYLRAALEGIRMQPMVAMSPTRFEALGRENSLEEFDVIVLDDYAPVDPPPGRYLSFGATPPLEGLTEYGEGGPQLIIDYDRDHPIMRFVNLDDIVVQTFRLIQPGDDVTAIAEINNDGAMTPAVVEIHRGGLHVIHFAFDLLDSTLPIDRTFPTFIVNAIEYLGASGQTITARGFQPGGVITDRLPREASNIVVTTPDGRPERPSVLDPAAFSWGPIRQAGVYTINWDDNTDAPPRVYASNRFADREGLIQTVTNVVLSEDQVEGEVGAGDTYIPLWPWAVGACLALLMAEWWVYHRKSLV